MKKIARFIDQLFRLVVWLWWFWLIGLVIVFIPLPGEYQYLPILSFWGGYSTLVGVLLLLAAFAVGIQTAKYEHHNNDPDELARYGPPCTVGAAWYYFILLLGNEVPPWLVVYSTLAAGIYVWFSWDYARYLDRQTRNSEMLPT